MAFEGKNPNKESLILNNKAAAGVPDAPTGKIRIIQRNGTIFAQDDTGSESAFAGDVTAAANFATDNRIIRSDGTGKGVQSSAASINDDDEMSGIERISVVESGAVSTDISLAEATSNSFSGTCFRAKGPSAAGNKVWFEGDQGGTVNCRITGNGRFEANDGAVGNPGFKFLSDTNTGIYRIGADNMGFTTAGVLRMALSATGGMSMSPASAPTGSHVVHLTGNYDALNSMRLSNGNAGTNAGSVLFIGGNTAHGELRKNSSTNTAGGGSNTFNVLNNSGGVYLDVGDTAWSAISDMRFKKKISDFKNGLGKIKGLSTFLYTLNDQDNTEHKGKLFLGMSAQECVEKIPEIVTGDPKVKMGMQYERLSIVLVSAVQELAEENTQLKAENGSMRDQLATLSARLDKIESRAR